MKDDTAQDRDGAKRASARERVYALVRDAILRGDYAGGEFLEEETVCRAADVSRTPVREAFHRLASERFLDLLPRRGARVRPVTARDMIELYETRRLIEGFAIDRICAQDKGATETLAPLVAELRRLGDADLHTHVDLDRRFHRRLVSAAGNMMLVEAYDGLQARQQRVALAAVTTDPTRLSLILDEHDSLLAALDARDASRARDVLALHLQPIDAVLARLP
jgi:DNA-binding GntR family transcriptional regulator